MDGAQRIEPRAAVTPETQVAMTQNPGPGRALDWAIIQIHHTIHHTTQGGRAGNAQRAGRRRTCAQRSNKRTEHTKQISPKSVLYQPMSLN